MMTIDTMIYIILAISGIATVSLYLNIYCAIRLRNTLDQSDKLDKANDAVEGLHLENMKLIEQKKELQSQLKRQIKYGNRFSIQQYMPSLDQSKIEKLLEIQKDTESRSRDDFKQGLYTKNIKTTTSDE
jgi:hypothetical protein